MFKYKSEILSASEIVTKNVWEIPMQGVIVNSNTDDASG